MKKNLLSVAALLIGLFAMSQGRLARSSDPKLLQLETSRKSSAPYSVLFREDANFKLSDAKNILARYVGLRQDVDELRLKTSDAGKDNITVNRYQQYFKGIKVEHGAYIATAKNGNIAFINGDFYSLKTNIVTTPQLNEAAALAKALESVGAKKYQWEMPAQEAFLKKETNDPSATYYPKGELVFVEDYNTGKELTGKVTLAYKFDVYASEPESRDYIYVDAKTGRILLTDAIMKHANEENNLSPKDNIPLSASNGWGIFRNNGQNEVPVVNSPTLEGTASTMYSGTVSIPTQLVGGTHRLQAALATENYPLHTRNLRNSKKDFAGATEFTDADNNWTAAEFNNATFDQVALDAHWGAAKVFDYWKTKHARNSYDNNNAVINSYVHYGTDVNNAAWDGTQMKYGDGTRTNGGFSPLAALDVCGHEIAHAVCTHTANLVYARESGAMNEGFSDIWGAAVERFADPHETDAASKSYFLIGEEIGLPVPNNPLRSMSDPKAKKGPDTYAGTNWKDASTSCTPGPGNDRCGVHTNSGVLNHWFFILVQGKTGTNDVGFSYDVTGIGWDDAEKLTYLTELNLAPSADYKACRTASFNAAATLFGVCDARTSTVLKAWDAVNVSGVAAEPMLTLTQDVTQQNEGLNVTYTNTLTSPCSAQPFSNYLLTDTIPGNAIFVSATNGGTLTGNVVKWPVDLAGGETKQYSFTVTVRPGSYFLPAELINEPVGTALPAGWVATTAVPVGGTPWVSSTTKSHSAPNSLFGVDRSDAASDMMISTNSVAVGATPYILSFWHDYNTEGGWDGGVVEISTNGAAGPWNDLGSFMSQNGYNSFIQGEGNLADRSAFSGNSGGFIQTKVKLDTSFAGQNAMFRFRCGSDENTAPAGGGWYVDDILLRTEAFIDIRSNLFNTGGTRVRVSDTSTIILPNLGCPIIATQPSNTTVCNASPATFTVTASGSNMTYKWQESTNGGGLWNDLAVGAPYSGVATPTLTIDPATLAMNNNQYRCIVTKPDCTADAGGATSNAAILTVVAASVGGNITPAVNAVCGTTNGGTLTLVGQVGNIIRWEYNTTSATGPTWTAIANTTTTHTYSNLTQTTWFRAVVMVNGCVQITSSVAVVNVTAADDLLIIADPGTVLCAAGDTTRLTVMEQAPPVPVTVNCSSSNTIMDSTSISCSNDAHSHLNNYFRVYDLSAFPAVNGNYTINSVTFGISKKTRDAQNITVVLYDQTGAAFPGGTRTQIATQTVSIIGDNVSGTLFTVDLATPVTVSNTQTIILEIQSVPTTFFSKFFIGSNAEVECGPSYIQAEACGVATPTILASLGYPNMHIIAFLNGIVSGVGSMVTGGTFTWTPAAGLSSTTTNPVVASPDTTTTYTVDHNDAGCIRQANITITVDQRPAVTTDPSSTNVCEGGTTTFSAATAGATVKWQFSTTGAGGTFKDVPAAAPYSGVTTHTLTVGPATMAMNGYAFRIVVTGTCTPAATSTEAILTVNTPLSITAKPVNDTTCADAGAATFAVGVAGPDPGHNWRESTDAGATWTDVTDGAVYSGAKTATLTITAPPASMNGYWYKDSITTASCAGIVSDSAMLVINPLPIVAITAAPYTSLLPGSTTTLTASSTPVVSQYQWQWYKDSVAIGGNSPSIQVDVDGLGLYSVTVRDLNGCGSSSNSILISDSASGRVFIYPNPNSGIFQVRYHSSLRNTNLPRGMNIYDDKGARVLMQRYAVNGAYGRMDVDIRKYGTGTYWVEVVDANGDRLAIGRVIILR